MSIKYTKYVDTHINNVQKAYIWLRKNLPEEYFPKDKSELISYNIRIHDMSKYSKEEYNAYDKYFYNDVITKEDSANFDLAWIHHIHNNPHHWEYWLLYSDGVVKALPMPYEYIIEMIADWLSFSILNDDMSEIFSFYDMNRDKIVLHDETRLKVENILNKINEVLS